MQTRWIAFTLTLLSFGHRPVTGYAQEVAPASAPKQADLHSLYGGLAATPLTISGLRTVHVSDWEYYGTGPSEGRVSLPLGNGNTSGLHAGLWLGYEGRFWALPVVLELGIAPGAVDIFSFGAGTSIPVLHGSRWALAATPKLGILSASVDMGKAKVLPGKTPPIITPIGTFQEGDQVTASTGGLFLQAAGTLSYRVREWPNIGIRAEAGVQLASLRDVSIEAGDVDIPLGAPAVVKPDGSTEQAGVRPKQHANGPYFVVAASYSF